MIYKVVGWSFYQFIKYVKGIFLNKIWRDQSIQSFGKIELYVSYMLESNFLIKSLKY